MRDPSPLAFVLRFHGLQLIGGLALLLVGVIGWVPFTPDPPELPGQSLADKLGIWPYLIGCIVGAGMAMSAWSKGSRLRNGR